MHHGAKIIGKVRFDKRKPSPLSNGGHQIIINIEVDEEDKEKLARSIIPYTAIIVTIQKEIHKDIGLDSMMKVRMIMVMHTI